MRIVVFGDLEPLDAPFPHEHLGIASPEQLAWAFSEATAGLVLSMTNYSLIPQEMLACGLPCVDLAGFSAETVFGADGPVELAPFDPVAIAEVVRDLHRSPDQPDQSYSERQMYEAALNRLAHELALVEKIDPHAATERLESLLLKVA